MHRFYALLDSAMDNHGKEVGYSTFYPTSWAVVRTQNGDHVTGNNVYFPAGDNSTTIEGLVRVKVDILKGSSKNRIDKAKKFLENTGVKEAGEQQEIEQILEKYYTEGAQDPTEQLHLQHIKRFISWWEKEKDISIFDGFYIFRSNSNYDYYKPEGLFIDLPHEETGLSVLFDLDEDDTKKALWHGYVKLKNKRFITFASETGILSSLKVDEGKIPYSHPDYFYLKCSSHGRRSDYEEDHDYYISDLENYLSKKSAKISLLIWETMCIVGKKF